MNSFVKSDPKLWASETRRLQLDGSIKHICLERAFWEVLEKVAKKEGQTLPISITELYFECREQGHDVNRFESFLRICCVQFLSQQSGLSQSNASTGQVLQLTNQHAQESVDIVQ